MANKTIIGLVVAALVLGGLIGRFSLPAKIVIKTETKESDKKQSDIDSNKQDHTVTTITQTKKPDGSVVTNTTIQNNVITLSQKETQESDIKSSKTDKETTYNTARWSISALAVTNVSLGTKLSPAYGGSVAYRLIGPFSVGVLGISDGIMGVSLGIQF